MKSKFGNINTLMVSSDQDQENDNISGPDSPCSSLLGDMKMSHSPKRSKRGVQKRVVSVPIKEVEGSRLKGENTQPPADSWAWRKYGQKPIKGSPYPRGYYRCSSSKGCPARKQVERSRVDPNVLVVTYSCEHNHPWPLPSRTHHHPKPKDQPKPELEPESPEAEPPEPEPEPEPELDEKFTDLEDESLIGNDHEFGWFDLETTSTLLESPIFAHDNNRSSNKFPCIDTDSTIFFPIREEEDESLFADLGELPECSSVFRHHRTVVEPEAQTC